jgi:(2Fe-2S) ferredoxin
LIYDRRTHGTFPFHLFVCTQQKPEGVLSCPGKGSFAVLDKLDHEIQVRGLSGDVQLTTCGCMGLCDEGPTLVVYPEGLWYRRVQPSDISEIVGTHLRDGKPVDRLVWNDAAAMHAMAVEHADKFRAAMAARDKAGTLPDHLDQMIRSYMPSRCILTALKLGPLPPLETAPMQEIPTRIHANACAVGMLLNALVALELLSKSGDVYL